MDSIFQSGVPGLYSGKSMINPSFIPVATMPLIGKINGLGLRPSNMSNSSAQFLAVAAGASVTLIPAQATQQWFIHILKVLLSIAGAFELQDGGTTFAFGNGVLNTILSPLGDLPYGMISANTNQALTLKNTSAAACTYNVTLISATT